VTWLSNDLVERLRDVATRPELATNRYAILRPIGRGGMGSVYAARDEQLGREVAIKVSNAAAPADDLDQRLRQEAKVLARLEHPGIVPVHDAGLLDDGRWFYIMKLVRGETLTDHAASLEHEAARLVVFERVAETVAFAHAAGIVHRDLKPSNVMVGQFGEVLVLDWGVARVLARVDRGGGPAARAADRHPDGAGDGTSGGTRMGTAGFMAPEQAQGDSSNDLARYRQGAAVSAYRDTAFERAAAF
jgi:eukaryotic-like serine/threonine-protein kinase